VSAAAGRREPVWRAHATALLIALLGVAMMLAASAARAAEPIVRVEVLARQPILVGQQVGIDVTVLVPNFFMSAPDFPLFQVPGAIVTMPDARAQNSTETIGGVTYAGIRKTYVFTAEQDGDFDFPAATIRFTYAGEDGTPRQGSVTLPPTHIRAGAGGVPGVPGRSATAGQPHALLPVGRLSVTQTLSPAPDKGTVRLHAGDALVRTVTVFAPQAQAMMIRPLHATAPRGVRMFSADARLSDRSGRGDGAGGPGGERVETFTYVFEREGSYTLPPLRADWLDPATGKPARSEAPGIRVVVDVAGPSGALAPERALLASLPDVMSWTAIWWTAGTLALALAGALAWLRLGPVLRRLRQRAASRGTREREAQARMAALLAACAAGDPAAAYDALCAWTRAAYGVAPAFLAHRVGDASLADAIAALERQLFSAAAPGAPWEGRLLAEAVRRHASVERKEGHHRAAEELPPLNPPMRRHT